MRSIRLYSGVLAAAWLWLLLAGCTQGSEPGAAKAGDHAGERRRVPVTVAPVALRPTKRAPQVRRHAVRRTKR